MKRILFMHHVSTIGGGSYCLLNILKCLDRTKVEPVVCLASDGPLKGDIENLGIEVIVFHQMTAVPYNRSLWSFSSVNLYYRVKKSVNVLKKILIDYHIDIVYLNNMMIYPYLEPAKECGCKTILHCREHWPLDEHTTQLQWARDAVYQYADELIAINQYSASIFPKKKATIVYDWIDMDSRYEYRPMSEILGEDSSNLKVYLYTGGVQRVKGAYQVLKVFHENVRDKNARLLVLGYDMQIPFVGKKFFLKKVLHSLGFDINEIKCRKLIQCDSRIVCISSTYMITHIIQQSYCMLSYFTIPHANLTLAECLVLGTPVIAAKTEESEEYSMGCLKDCLFDINDIDKFQQAIARFNYDKKKHDIERRRLLIKNKMSKIINDDKLIKVINNIAD